MMQKFSSFLQRNFTGSSAAKSNWQCRKVPHALLQRLISNSATSLDFDISEELTEPFNRSLIKVETVNRLTLIHKFKHIFNCNEQQARKIVDTNKSITKMSMAKLNSNIDLLFLKKVTNKCILENSWVLCTSPSKFFQFFILWLLLKFLPYF